MNLIWILIFSLHSMAGPSAFVIKPGFHANKVMQSDDLEFLRELFETNRQSGVMDCEIKTKFTKDIRRFRKKLVWTENLEIIYNAKGFDYTDVKFVISNGSSYGHRITSLPEQGIVEEFRIELDNDFGTYISFSHDGKGKLTGFIYGDIYHISPCQLNKSNQY